MSVPKPHLPPSRAYPKVLRAACMVTLLALAAMTWSVFDPHVWPIMVAMSVGQVLGTISLMMFGAVMLADLRRMRAAAHAAREAGIAPRSKRSLPPSGDEKSDAKSDEKD